MQVRACPLPSHRRADSYMGDCLAQGSGVVGATAAGGWSATAAWLDAGPDGRLAKPFQTEELIARLRALIRRASGNASSELIAGDIRLDTRSGKVTKDGEPVKLAAQEYKL